MSWTDERVELLRKLWSDGLSASQIAAQIGSVTRNAVIGKVHRLGLSGRAKTMTTAPRINRTPHKARPQGNSMPRAGMAPMSFGATALKTEAQPDVERAVEPAPAIPFPVPESQSRITLMQLTERTCRWPVGDPSTAEFRFCGANSEAGVPYCTYHCAIAYQPVSDRKRRAAGG